MGKHLFRHNFGVKFLTRRIFVKNTDISSVTNLPTQVQ